MPPAEVLHRLRQKLEIERIQYAGPPGGRDPAETRIAELPSFPDESFDAYRDAPESWRGIAARALGSERNTFSLLGAAPRDFGSPIRWNTDPVTGEPWPADQDSFRIRYRGDTGRGEVKYVWELGRMPWLLPRALAARVLRDGAVARTIVEDIASFVAANPPLRGIHWVSNIEGAVRIVAWTWSLGLVQPLVRLDPDFLGPVAAHIGSAAHLCRRFPSLHSSANNHLVAEAAAMEVAGRSWPGIRDAAGIAESGMRILDREIPRQILEDGWSIEGCPSYLLEVVEWSLAAAAVRRRAGLPVPEIWNRRWSAVSGLLRAFCGGGYTLPAIGDSDDARVFPTGHPHTPGGTAAVLDAASGNSSGRDLGLEPLAALVLPDNAAAQQGAPGENPAPASVMLPRGGVAILRSPGSRLVFDCGFHGMPPIHAHAHADALSVLLDVGGTPVLVDPGTYCYHGKREWRDWFRSTAAHNTLCVGGRDQSEMRGPFLWGRVAETRLLGWSGDPSPACCAEHNGYAPWIHRRRVSADESSLWKIEDWLESPPGRQIPCGDAVLWWHFAPGEVTRMDSAATWCAGGLRVVLEWSGAAVSGVTLHRGESSPPQGWISPGFSVRQPAPALAVRLAAGTSPACVTTIRLG